MTTKKHELKTYKEDECCVFRKTKELYGGLSNMASGYPLIVNGVQILSSEALYQACRFPHLPDIQKKIIKQRSPMSAKMVCEPFKSESRDDWDDARIKIMRWCLKVKLAQNFAEFGKLLESTFDKPIVEDSIKDDFWGAIRKKKYGNILTGTNALGRLLMELRQFYNEKRYSYEMFVVEPLNISDFKLFGKPIAIIDERENFISYIKKSTSLFEIKNLSNTVLEEKENEMRVENLPLLDEKRHTKKTKENTTGIRAKNKSANNAEQTTLPF